MSGRFVISLDFELLWGVRDHADRYSYGRNVLGARDAVPRILELFARNGISATWATVGFLFCESKEELLASLPDERPSYIHKKLSNYKYIEEVGRDENDDPYYFAPSLIEEIKATPGQEIGTHTLSHFYCLEDGATPAAFDADLAAARTLAQKRAISLHSIVFPRNQFAKEYLEICRKHGITQFRGNPHGWPYQAAKTTEQTSLKRAVRLIDAHTGLLGPKTSQQKAVSQPKEVPASCFLRPCAGQLARFHAMHLAAVKRGMMSAARSGTVYHLWWHPHNFGCNLEANMAGLVDVIDHFRKLHDQFGMQSYAMGEME